MRSRRSDADSAVDTNTLRTLTRSRRVLWGTIILFGAIGLAGAIERARIQARGEVRSKRELTERELWKLRAVLPPGVVPGTARFENFASGTIDFEAKYEHNRSLILRHVVPGALILLLAPLQFAGGVRRRYPRYHRWAGRLILLAVWISGSAALAFGLLVPFGGTPERIVTAIFGSLFLYFPGRGWRAIREGRVDEHREWMIRMYSLALAVGLIRVIGLLLVWLTPVGIREGFNWSLWSGFVISLAAAEIWIRRGRMARPSPTSRYQAIATDIL